MPAEVKTAHHLPETKPTSIEGKAFQFQNDTERQEALDLAFDYRGDVTLTLASGENLEGFLSNRNAKAVLPFVELWIKGENAPRKIAYGEISGLSFSGADTAFGKSWDDWKSKSEKQRLAEIARHEADAQARGEL